MAERIYKSKRELGGPRVHKGGINHHAWYTERLRLRAFGTTWKGLLDDTPLNERFVEKTGPFPVTVEHILDSRIVFAHAIDRIAKEAGPSSYAVRLLEGALASLFRDSTADPRTSSPAWPLLRVEANSAREWLALVMARGEATDFVVETLRAKNIRASASTLDNWLEKEAKRYDDYMIRFGFKENSKLRLHDPSNWPKGYRYSPRYAGDMTMLGRMRFRGEEAVLEYHPVPQALSELKMIEVIKKRRTFADEYEAGEWLPWHDKKVKDATIAKAWRRCAKAIIDPVAEIVAKS
jgi:hypothetical protein